MFLKQLSFLKTLGASLGIFIFSGSLQAATTFTATQASTDSHIAAPEWYKDAKLGIYFHWGLFSVPNHSSEWYGTYMYQSSNAVASWHKSNMGDQWGTDSATNWGYDKFATGKNNAAGKFMQFKPVLKAFGGVFDTAEYGNLLDSAGARYAGTVTMHHDGYAMWDSKTTEWNSMQKGPHLDLVGLLARTFRARGMRIISSFHHAYHMSGFWSGVPKQTNPSLKFFYAQTDTESQIWLNELNEEESLYHPDVIWHDFNVGRVGSSYVLKHLAYYYNKGVDWDKEVVMCYKDGMSDKGQLFDYERNIPKMLVNTRYWGTDVSTGSHWNQGGTYFKPGDVLDYFIDIVSKNGNLLLNFGPYADGSIDPGIKTILFAMGSWLHKFGETIYCTRAWTTYGEGPTIFGTGLATGNSGNFDPKTSGTAADIRYTTSKDGKNLFAIFMGWPSGSRTLKSVTTASFPIGSTGTVYLYGETPEKATKLTFTEGSSGLQVTFPSSAPYSALAYAIKISKTGEAPKGMPAKTPLPASDAIFNTALKDSGQAFQVNNAVVNRSEPITNKRMTSMYCITQADKNGIMVPQNARSVEIYSIQGKKLYNQQLQGSTVFHAKDHIALSNGTYYVKFTK